MSSKYSVRKAIPGDADAIGGIHARAWEATYRGTLADETLDALEPGKLAVEWRTYLEEEITAVERMWVLVDDSMHEVVGYCRAGPARDKDLASEVTGEVYGLYVDPSHWDQGAGKELFTWAVEDFADRAFDEVTLWVVDTNERARHFYERNGFIYEPGPTNTCFGAPEVRYRKPLSRGGK